MSAGKKKLTEAPTNLKEAIDWALKIQKDGGINQLAEALEALLKNDKDICEKFCKDCVTRHSSASAQKQYLNKLPSFDRVQRSGDEGDGNILRKFRGEFLSFQRSITKLPDGLKKFSGANEDALTSFTGNGIIKSDNTSSYNPAYNGAQWTSDEAEDCAVLLIAVAPLIYLALGLLYGKSSKKKKNNRHNGWKEMKLKDSNGTAPQAFMTEMGFLKDSLNENQKGEQIVQSLNGFTELTTTYDSKSTPLYTFFKQFHDQAHRSSSSSPLTYLYLLSYYYITNFLYIVEPTSPATPSFLGYSGTAALAGGAYGLNLGGVGTVMSAFLA
ncbi:variant erythrocyte surface antigen-1 family protein [Babesia caballi]|uniref:Variant erythrocyte surface antigen-1 family protein n=1 Tax=Babesia caballi TaxID=5871 RepID=A0AAV4LRZ1_BABCB|nr:variant erythrocyte surface antigen-1 family protein [Babesia caballi]